MKEIFLNTLLLKQDFLSYFCYILNVFTIIFFEWFLCMFFVSFFFFFFYILHIFITLQYNTKQYKRGQHKHSLSADSVSD